MKSPFCREGQKGVRMAYIPNNPEHLFNNIIVLLLTLIIYQNQTPILIDYGHN